MAKLQNKSENNMILELFVYLCIINRFKRISRFSENWTYLYNITKLSQVNYYSSHCV